MSPRFPPNIANVFFIRRALPARHNQKDPFLRRLFVLLIALSTMFVSSVLWTVIMSALFRDHTFSVASGMPIGLPIAYLLLESTRRRRPPRIDVGKMKIPSVSVPVECMPMASQGWHFSKRNHRFRHEDQELGAVLLGGTYSPQTGIFAAKHQWTLRAYDLSSGEVTFFGKAGEAL